MNISNQKPKTKVIRGFEPGSAETAEIFQMDEELPVDPSPESKIRPSQASIVSPSVSFQERLFPNLINQTANSSTASVDVEKQQKPPLASQPSQKTMTKAERRELQEKQRAEKAAKLAASGKAPQPKGGQKPKPSTSPPRQFSDGAVPAYRPPTNKKLLKRQSDVSNPRAVALFAHLNQYNNDPEVLREKSSSGLIHPAIVSLGVQYSEMTITGGNARCMAMLIAFKKVISDYVTPSGTSLHRHLTQHISKQVDYLTVARTLAVSMRTAIRFVKFEIANLDSSLPDADAKKKLCESIDDFINMRILLAQESIVENILRNNKVKIGDVILTFGRSSTVIKLLKQALEDGLSFSVIVVDSRSKLEGYWLFKLGKEALKEFVHSGIKCTYVMTSALPFVIKKATKVIIGASSILSNGDLMSRVGTSVVCMAAFDAKVPVVALCETYKFSEQVRLDSFVWNELANPLELVDVSNRPVSQRLPSSVPTPYPSSSGFKAGKLKSDGGNDTLKLLNLTYDITPANFITMVACEDGLIPSTLVLSVLRNHPIVKE